MVKVGAFGILIDDSNPDGGVTIMGEAIQTLCLVIGFISYTAGVLVALSYILSKKLRSHPSFLIVLMCICESIATFHMLLGTFNVTDLVKTLGLNDLLYHLLFKMDLRSESSQIRDLHERYAELLCESNNMMVNTFSQASIMFNICLCIDLLLTLRNPFSPPQRRNKFFIGITVCESLFMTYALRSFLKGPCRLINSTQDRFQARST